MTTWNSNNKLTRDTELFEAIGKIRGESDKRREIEARVLAENNLASVRQLSEDKKKQFCAIVDAILAETADVNTQLFSDPTELSEAAAKVKMTPWTKQDNNPEKNSTFTGAPKTNPNKGGYAGGAKAEKTKHGYTAMKRIKEDGEDLQELSKDTLNRYVDSATDSAERGRLAAGYASRDAIKFRGYKGKNQQARDEYERVAKKRDGDAVVALKHRDKRLAGVKMANKKLTKEDLQELSKDTLRSYLSKASKDAAASDKKAAVARDKQYKADRSISKAIGRGDKAGRDVSMKDRAHHRSIGNAYAERSLKRQSGMNSALDRLHKEDLEEMYLDIENFILESEGYDSIDRLNEQGQEKLAAIVENVMEEILSEGEEEYDESLDENLGAGMKKIKFRFGTDPRATKKTLKDNPDFAKEVANSTRKIEPKSPAGLQRRLAKKLTKEETMEEGWFSKKTPVEKENAMRRSIKKTDDSVQKHGAAYEKTASRVVRGALGMKQKWTKSGYKND